MPKLGVDDLKALLAEAEEKGHEDVDVSHLQEEDEGSSFEGSEGPRRRSSSMSLSEGEPRDKAKKSTAQMTRELTDLYRHAIAQTSDGTLGYEDIKTLVTSFAGVEPNETQMRGIMTELDEDGDGDVTESEWVNFCLKQLGDFVLDAGDEDGREEEELSLFERMTQQWKEIDWETVYYRCKDGVKYFLEDMKFSMSFDDMIMAMTLFVLFADNIRLLAAKKEDDFGFEVANSICLFSFIAEFIATTWSKTTWESLRPMRYKGFFNSFYWYLDLLAILSMFPDINWIATGLSIGNLSQSVGGNSSISGVGKIFRLMRLVRLVRLYKIFTEKRKRMKIEKELLEQVRQGLMNYDDVDRQKALYQERKSALGSLLQESIKARVILLILTVVIFLPLITYTEVDYSPYTCMDMLHTINDNSSIADALKDDIVTNVVSLMDGADNPDIIYLNMYPYSNSVLVNRASRLDYLRDSAMVTIELGTNDGSSTYTKATFDNSTLVESTATLNIGLTLFVGFMLLAATVVFNADAQDTVMTPIERMMNMLEEIVKDPLQPLSFDHSNPAGPGEYETRLLENTVEKITGLLRVGFGEAGAGIISANLSLDSSGSKVNPLLPGIKVYVIVGFCDIHHFEDVLVQLTDDVLTFVNTIAEIVHENVAHWGGQCNKNLGNAFVILWRIDDEEKLHMILNTSKFSKKSSSSGTEGAERSSKRKSADKEKSEGSSVSKAVDLRRVPGINVLADQALIGYLKIIAEINRNKSILKYRNEPRLTHNGTQTFKVSMGFGLHAGWAIEGAVGSLYKVDATYLSPHVNMAARLETSSRQYGVPLLASHFVHELLSPEVQNLCRMVDVVTVKGSEVPVGVYTYDCLEDQVFRTKPDEGENKKKENVKPQQSGDKFGAYELEDVRVVVASEAAARVTKHGKDMQAVAPLDVDLAPGFLATNHGNQVKVAGAKSPKQTTKLRDNKKDLDEETTEGFFLNNDSDTVDVFEMDDDLLMLRAHVKENFTTQFSEGIKVYLEGDWTAAKKLLETANKTMTEAAPTLGGDGPCITLLNYMEARNWQAPSDWAGYRPLTSK